MIPVKDNTKVGYYNNGRAIAGKRMKLGHNVSWFKAWAGSGFLKDQMRQSRLLQLIGAPVQDVNGWYDCTAGGTFAQYLVWNSLGVRKDGQYILRWAGTGTVTLVQGSLVESGDHYAIYDSPTGTGNYWVEATAGYPTDITLVRVEEEADYIAGNNIDKTFLENISGSSCIRYMDAMDTNDSDVLYPSEYTSSDIYNDTPYMPMKYVAEISNRSSTDPWVNVPAMANDATVLQLATELFNDLDTNRKVYVEYGNELWNFASGFSNSFQWNLHGDITVYEPSVDPTTSVVTQVAHGLTTGDVIGCFNNPTQNIWPFAFGAGAYVIVDDVDHFRLADTEANALINVDLAPLNASVTKLRYKVTANKVFTEYYNYALRAVECWDIFVGIFGRDRVVKVGAGMSASPGRTTNILNSYAPFKEQFDLFAIAPYFNINDLADYENATLSEIQTYLTDVEFPSLDVLIADHITAIGRNALICYEGSDHSRTGSLTAPQEAKIEEWTASTEAGESFTEYLQMLADANIKQYENFTMVEPVDGGNAFGLMRTPLDVNYPKRVSWDAQIAKGGVGK